MNVPLPPADRVCDVLVVGAGPAGLAVVHELLRAGLRPHVVDAAARVGQPWRDRHDRLRLNTHRRFSALPGLAFPSAAGAFPHRDEVVAYLEEYERRLDVPVSYRTPVGRLDPCDDGWLARTPEGDVRARDVVVATGPDRVPVRPHWPGEEDYAGDLLHAAELRELDALAGKAVLVVGGGNSGVDLASALTRIGVRRLWVSVRGGATVLPRRLAGVPVHPLGVASRRLPVWWQDASARALSWAAFGDLQRLGLPRPTSGAKTLFLRRGTSPATDDGFVAALRSGALLVVPEIAGFSARTVTTVEGRILDPDVVVCATGYRTGLEPVVGHLGVLDAHGRPDRVAAPLDAAPGLWFAGHRPPFHGNLFARGPEARQLVRALTSRRAAAVPRPRLPAQASSPGSAADPRLPAPSWRPS